VLWLRRLQLGGYPFQADELSLEEWIGLGRAADLLRRLEKLQEMKAMMPKRMGL